MADEALLKILRRGVDEWNDWRQNHPDVRFLNLSNVHLSGADLSGASLSGVWLRDADLSGAYLFSADLRRVDLSRANLTDANLVGVNLSGANLSSVNLSGANLSGASLSGARLSNANLCRANFSHADLGSTDLTYVDLSRARLSGAFLPNADLSGADLTGARLRRANLAGANLTDAILWGADISGADLLCANFSDAQLSRTKFNGSRAGDTVFHELDLREAEGLETVSHSQSSAISVSTIFKSEGEIPEVFLRGCGVPESLIVQIQALVAATQPIQFYSCFISYSHADKSFARRLYDALQGQGIRCWLDEHQVLPGDDVFEQVDRGIRLWDKVLLCCSKDSLTSWWVDDEITRAFDKEQQLMRQRGQKVLALVPLNLDGYMFGGGWGSGKATQIKSRLAADFTGWKRSNKKFEEQFERLVRALRADAGGREPPPVPKL